MSIIKPIVYSIVNPIVQSIASTPNAGSSGLVPFFSLTNMGIVQKQGGTGTLINSSTSAKTFLDNTGEIVTTNAGEIVIEGARRVDHADGTDYGYNSLGIKYYDTDSSGDAIVPAPLLRSLDTLTNNVWPSKTTDITDYPTRSNVVNRTVTQGIFTHAAAIDVAGTTTWLYQDDLTAIGSTVYTTVVWMKMDDGSEPVIASTATDTGGDFNLVLGGDSFYSGDVTSSITSFGSIYCLMISATTEIAPASATNCGLIQQSNQSDKKWEIYSIGVLDGAHLFPVYIPTVSAGTTWDDDNLNIDSTSNNFDDIGMIVSRFKMTNYTSDAGGIWRLSAAVADAQLYISTVDRVRMGDSTSQFIQGGLGSINNVDMVAVSFWNDAESLMGPGLTNNIGVTALSLHAGGAYDGAFSDTGTANIFSGSISTLIKGLKIYHPPVDWTVAQQRTWLIDNATDEINP